MTTTNKPLPTSTLRPALLAALSDAPGGVLTSGEATRRTVEACNGDLARDSHNVANARFDAKARGLVDDAGRGLWRITDAGRAVVSGAPLPAAAKRDNPPAKQDATPAATGESPELKRSEEPAPEARGEVLTEVDASAKLQAARLEAAAPAPKRRLKVANAPAAPAVDIPEWLADDDIRAMAVESTECFGAWAAKASECGKCALAGWCRNAKASTLALLASKLTTETPAAPAPVKPSVAKLDEAVSTANAPEAPRAATSDPGGLTMKARHDGVCAVSGRPIKVGDAVRYKAGLGIYHAGEVLTTA